MIFDHMKENDKKESKPVRICSKKQTNHGTLIVLTYRIFVIYFIIYVCLKLINIFLQWFILITTMYIEYQN